MRWRKADEKGSVESKADKNEKPFLKTITSFPRLFGIFFPNFRRGTANWRPQLLTMYIYIFYSLKLHFSDKFLHQWAPTFNQNSLIFQRVWIDIHWFRKYVRMHSKRAKGRTNQFKNSSYFSGVGESDRCLWTRAPFIQCQINNVMYRP